MFSILLGAIGGWELAMLGGPFISKLFIKKSNTDILLYGRPKVTEIRFVDSMLEKQVGELTWLQAKSHAKLLSVIRLVISTRAFELILAKTLKEKWCFNTGFIQS